VLKSGCRAEEARLRTGTPGQADRRVLYSELARVLDDDTLFGDPALHPYRGSRERIYELFCTAAELGTHFLVRTCVDRLAGDGGHTIADEMAETAVAGQYPVDDWRRFSSQRMLSFSSIGTRLGLIFFLLGGHDGGRALGSGRGQVLDPREVQRYRCPQSVHLKCQSEPCFGEDRNGASPTPT